MCCWCWYINIFRYTRLQVHFISYINIHVNFFEKVFFFFNLIRTPGTGLYDNLKQFKIPYPEAIFDIEYFSSNPKPFFTLAKEIMPSIKYKPNKIHYFLRLLQEKRLLQRLYTQNIDGLERTAGIITDKLVEAHGTFSSARCLGCKCAYSEAFIRVSYIKFLSNS
jgi:NAD-dependent deacetylase sirtuin 3